MTLKPKRTVAELKELRALTGDENGAQRVCWTGTWAKARAWMRDKLAALPIEVTVDEAGNQWATLRGKSDKAMLIGGHIDSVPNGGWQEHLELSVQVLDRLASKTMAWLVVQG
jgi:N-carbamoyl-L-amino-acid hydrolase